MYFGFRLLHSLICCTNGFIISLFFHICKGFSIFSLNFSLILTFYSHSNPFPGQLPLREPPRSCPQRKNERRQIPLTPFVVGVISKKLSFSHPSKTLAAVDGTIRLRLERNPRLSAARGTHRGEIFPGAAGSGLAGIPASLAALRLILEASLCIEFLLSSGEHELVAALFSY